MMKKHMSLFFALLLLLGGCSPPAENEQGTTPNSTAPQLPTATVPAHSTPTKNSPTPEDSTLTVTFLDVGQGDAALVECDGAYMLIDGGEATASNLLYSVLKDREIAYLDYVVGTHAHSDHVGGLSGALNYAKPGTVYCPAETYDSKAFDNFVKYVAQGGAAITAPEPGTSFPLGGATITLLGPTREYEEINDTSIVLRIDHGVNSFLFTGDMERAAELDLVDVDANLEATVLKVGHHGSSSSSTYPFLRAVNCEYAVISCAEDNSYGHPHEETLSKLHDADANVLRTDLSGDITFVSDEESLTVSTERKDGNTSTPSAPDAGATTAGNYIGNLNSMKFHLPSCNSLPKESNRLYFDSREKAVSAGYSPCGGCRP